MGSRGSRVVVHQDQAAWTDSLQNSIAALECKVWQLVEKGREDERQLRHKTRQLKELQTRVKGTTIQTTQRSTTALPRQTLEG
jgi:hypothetical protein